MIQLACSLTVGEDEAQPREDAGGRRGHAHARRAQAQEELLHP